MTFVSSAKLFRGVAFGTDMSVIIKWERVNRSAAGGRPGTVRRKCHALMKIGLTCAGRDGLEVHFAAILPKLFQLEQMQWRHMGANINNRPTEYW